ncbi:Uu.00g105610.m01.CDS01 [Anthostomella pinea]|uniref:Uu.00g105610.m01.CDS01 n=1 Tax=Anthostomella pinea TaxID=933095 RepID=A0AAI8VDX4_9PEZI|nr:Uu.00g105610.m01.CDS01 [Anthostomella pinea]
MDSPPAPAVSHSATEPEVDANVSRPRRESLSQKSEDSQTAADFIRDQMQLEADAREALPYSIENCTRPLGSLRQNVFACLTCNPAPTGPDDTYNPAGVCYSCSVQCHGKHELVEIFQKRNFTCDCGTTRFTPDQQCTLRIDPETNTKGGVHSEPADPNNKYNQNFRNNFCSCSIDYKPREQKGTMFQCLGLGTHETGGCGEDWFHPGCLVGMGPRWYEKMPQKSQSNSTPHGSALAPISEDAPQNNSGDQQNNESTTVEVEEEDAPLPDGFPGEDDFDHFLCYKCVEAYPWIQRYAGTTEFLPAVFYKKEDGTPHAKKRKLEDDGEAEDGEPIKRVKRESEGTGAVALADEPIPDDVPIKVKEEEVKGAEVTSAEKCKWASLPPAPAGQFSLFIHSDFRDQFCRCASCFPNLKSHPQLLEEEEAYEPPLSASGSDHGSAHGSGSLYERGESALKNVDRVRAIEGVMAYNHLKEKLQPFFQKFAKSGKAIGAEDINEYFAKLRGDEQAIKDAGEGAKADNRKEQSGY